MSELGQVLRQAREAKGVSLAEAEEATKIRQKYLRALEEGDYDALPPSVYVRGFLRNYASYLDLDPQHVLQLYAQVAPQQGGPTEPHIIAEPLVPPSRVNWELVAGILLLIAVGILGVWVYRHYIVPLAAAPTATPPPAPAVAAAGVGEPAGTPEGPEPSPTATRRPTATLAPVVPTATAPPPTATPLPRPTATVAVLPTEPPGLTLVLRTTGRTWVRVIVDGEKVLEQTLGPGQVRTWRAQHEVRLRTGNAGGVEVTVNGQELGPLGAPGQVLERIWTITQNGVVRVSTPTP